jgi:hypothetical protein
MRRADGQKDDRPVIFVATIHSRHTWRAFLHMSSGDVVEDTRIPVGMERFANARRNGNFQHSHVIVFEQELVILWRCGDSVVLGCPPLIEVLCPSRKAAPSAPSNAAIFTTRFIASLRPLPFE